MYAPARNLRTAHQPRRPGMVSSVPAAQISDIANALREDLAALNLNLSDAQQQQQLTFLNHLLHWNALINLSAITEPMEMLTVHIVDSLAAMQPIMALQHGMQKISILDVGSGPGLPAAPWAIALPAAQIHAVDSVRKKIDTIKDFIAKSGLPNLSAEHARIETVRREYDVVTSRAFSSLKNFVTLAGPRVKGGGLMLALKGKIPDDEIAELHGSGWEAVDVVTLRVPRLNAERHNVILRRR